jgi:hypothetical protein
MKPNIPNFGLVAVRTATTRPSPNTMPTPSAGRRRLTNPARAASPNHLITAIFTGAGARSMSVEPTTSTGEDAGAISVAAKWPTARPTSAATAPNIAKVHRDSPTSIILLRGRVPR